MNSSASRYTRLMQAYVKLSDQFHHLDVEHMALKQKLIPLLKALNAYRSLTHKLKQDKATLEQTIQSLSASQTALEAALAASQVKQAELLAAMTTLSEEKAQLESSLQAVQLKYEALAEFETLLQPDAVSVLAEAEQQMELVEETLQEIELDSDPDLSEVDKQLLLQYRDRSDLIAEVNALDALLAA
ncbi:MAG: hypothetical protein F6J97_15435 [Leptolyngbya sp. SIO4C1]|nr:hypothetical protein [Leptolyngbya sp. SIO4C1]